MTHQQPAWPSPPFPASETPHLPPQVIVNHLRLRVLLHPTARAGPHMSSDPDLNRLTTDLSIHPSIHWLLQALWKAPGHHQSPSWVFRYTCPIFRGSPGRPEGSVRADKPGLHGVCVPAGQTGKELAGCWEAARCHVHALRGGRSIQWTAHVHMHRNPNSPHTSLTPIGQSPKCKNKTKKLTRKQT